MLLGQTNSGIPKQFHKGPTVNYSLLFVLLSFYHRSASQISECVLINWPHFKFQIRFMSMHARENDVSYEDKYSQSHTHNPAG